MKKAHKITMLGTGLIGMFYTMTLHKYRSRDVVHTVYSRSEGRAKKFAEEWDIPNWTTDMEEAVNDPETDVVIVGVPNHLHKDAVIMAAESGKAVLCTKPLGRTAEEAKVMLEAVENAGVFSAYLEDLVYTPKTLKSLESVKNGALGRILWVRSRETHPGPHSAWFWEMDLAGGGAIIDMGCHCAEIIRNFIGKDIKPVEVMCWSDTLVHNIEAEDHGIALIRFQNGSVGQFEVSWAFRGGMDLRDEISGTEGTIWIDHFLRTGFQMFTSVGQKGYVAEKAELETGWLFPVGDEVNELGYTHMFIDVFDALDNGREPMETFYDGYIVNAIIDACYRSSRNRKWEPVILDYWRGKQDVVPEIIRSELLPDGSQIIKQERLPDGRVKLILRDKESGRVVERITD